MTNPSHKESGKIVGILWASAGILAVALLFARAVYPEYLWLTIVIAVALVGALGMLIQHNAQALKGRTAAYSFNSIITIILVLGIVGVVNFLGHAHPGKIDLTKNKIHTMSDQTVKVVKGLQKPVKAVLFAKMQQKEQFKPLLDNFRQLNPGKFDIEYVDPDKEPTRAKQVGIKKYGTLQLLVGTRENKLEEPTEEKLTNAIIKITKEKTQTLCSINGHGEKSFNGSDAEGYDTAKKSLLGESYEVKDINLITDTKIPEVCDAITILGPTKSFFEPEIKSIREYLENGGRAIVAIDINIKGGEYAPELVKLLSEWNIKAPEAMMVDPLSKMLGVDASVSIIATYSKDNAITKDMQGNCFFPFLRPLDIEKTDPDLKATWIGQTTPKSWAITDMKALASGQVKVSEGKDRSGPLNAAVAISGKKKGSKSVRDSRVVVFGTSFFATNNYSRFGGNLDFYLNAVSWVMEDESLISIRSKEDGPGKVELTQKEGTVIFLLTVILIPLVIAVAGIVIWVVRRRL